MLNLEWALKWHFFTIGTGPITSSGQSCGEGCKFLHIDGDDRGGGLVLADTGKVKDDKEKKHFDIENMMDDFLAVETMNTVLMGLAMANSHVYGPCIRNF